MKAALWNPDPEIRANTGMTRFAGLVSQKLGKVFPDYQSFHRWSCDDKENFWKLCSDFVDVHWRIRPQSTFVKSALMRNCVWFPNSQLNYAENILINLNNTPIVQHDESGNSESLSRDRFLQLVLNAQKLLISLGVCKGDRVAGIVTNRCEAIACMLAATAMGAIWSSCSPDFGYRGLWDRLNAISPKVVFYVPLYFYAGKQFCIEPIIEKLKSQMDGQFILLHKIHEDPAEPNVQENIHFESLPFSYPLYILFSSGTTGAPKCIVHGHGGTILQHKKEFILHCDLRCNDRMLYFTTCGWMMWNWMISGLSCGATIHLYDGCPGYPDPLFLWKTASTQRLTHFGTSPKYIASSMAESQKLSFDFSSLRCVLSTGSPLLPTHYQWVYHAVKSDIHLASISGGTDIVSCFMLGNPNLPVYPGEIQCFGLGMDCEVWDENGNSVRQKKGELVCVSSFPSMPVCFWNDADGRIYSRSYFDFYKGRDVWRHGDFVELTSHEGIIVYGRSDATLNPGGIRIGTAEIYRALEDMPGVLDAVAIGLKSFGDVEIVLLVKVNQSVFMDADYAENIKKHLRTTLSPRHVPKYVFSIDDIPVTRSGKKMEILVASILNGETTQNVESVSNPDSLQRLHELRKILHSTPQHIH